MKRVQPQRLKRESFYRFPDALYKKVIGSTADQRSDKGDQAAAGLCAHSQEEAFGNIFQYGAGHEKTGLDADGDGDDRHKFVESDVICSPAIVNDAKSDAELLGKVIEHVYGNAQNKGNGAAETRYGASTGCQPGAMFYIGVDAHFVDAFFNAMLIDAIEHAFEACFRQSSCKPAGTGGLHAQRYSPLYFHFEEIIYIYLIHV